MFDVKRSVPEKILSGILAIMLLSLYVAVPCGVAWVVSLFGVAINYLIPAGIGVFIFVLHILIVLTSWIRFKKVDEEISKGFKF
jgi:uncharacterized membrane protein (DUF485 family)